MQKNVNYDPHDNSILLKLSNEDWETIVAYLNRDTQCIVCKEGPSAFYEFNKSKTIFKTKRCILEAVEKEALMATDFSYYEKKCKSIEEGN